ncbi:MAG: type II toxin-antitoxin system mRNA interferase toxin, RelE/StbE family [Candidatus Firestonebacteria bacterium]
MLNVIWDDGFKRIYKKKIKNNEILKDRLWKTIRLFTKDPFQIQLRTHKLSGELAGLWAFSITYDYRVVFKFTNKTEVLLIDIGSHDEVY